MIATGVMVVSQLYLGPTKLWICQQWLSHVLTHKWDDFASGIEFHQSDFPVHKGIRH